MWFKGNIALPFALPSMQNGYKNPSFTWHGFACYYPALPGTISLGVGRS